MFLSAILVACAVSSLILFREFWTSVMVSDSGCKIKVRCSIMKSFMEFSPSPLLGSIVTPAFPKLGSSLRGVSGLKSMGAAASSMLVSFFDRARWRLRVAMLA